MHKCDCGKPAVWVYMPGFKDGSPYACDDCVNRGCSCNDEPIDGNWENIDPNNWQQALDDKGRKLPCCEWEFIDENNELLKHFKII